MKSPRALPHRRWSSSCNFAGSITAAAVALVAALGARPSWAASDEQCATAYERGQELRRAGALVEARKQLLSCNQPSCPPFISADCRHWLDDLDAALPTVVFSARLGGRDLEQVLVEVDGRRVTDHLDGRAVAIDPGKHRFTFRAPGQGEARVDAIINEGSKHRLISVDIPAAPAATPPSRPAITSAPPAELVAARSGPTMPPLARGLFITSAVGLVGFVGLGLWGLHDERALREECAPTCAPARVDRVHRQYVAADLSLAIGAVALGLGAYLHGHAMANEAPPRIALRLWDGGGTLSIGERF